MKRSYSARLGIFLSLLLMLLVVSALFSPLAVSVAFAQDVPSADTPTPEPPTFTPTFTTVPETPTPSLTPTPVVATATAITTPTPGPTATPRVVPIPEPVTVVLFGTGLAALSAAVASRRSKDGKR